MTVTNTIIAKNTAGNMNFPDSGASTGRSFSSGGNNRLTSTAPGFTAPTDYINAAVDYIVTGLADTYNHANDSTVLSLRDAIDNANNLAAAQEIWLPAWNFVLTWLTRLHDSADRHGRVLRRSRYPPIAHHPRRQWFHYRPMAAGAAVDAVFDLLGDYNGDGISSADDGSVDSADYVIWRYFFQHQELHDLRADGNDNGVIDQGDYNVWAAHFGNTLTLLGV